MSLPYPLHHHPKFAFWKLEPERIYYVGGFGVQSTWYVRTPYANTMLNTMLNTVPLPRDSASERTHAMQCSA